MALRGLFIVDPDGILRQSTINDLPVGRSVDETLRLIQAFQFHAKVNGRTRLQRWRFRSPDATPPSGCSASLFLCMSPSCLCPFVSTETCAPPDGPPVRRPCRPRRMDSRRSAGDTRARRPHRFRQRAALALTLSPCRLMCCLCLWDRSISRARSEKRPDSQLDAQ